MPENGGPSCKCGCGERLPYGSVREYKRGHKANPPAVSRTPNPSTTEHATADTWVMLSDGEGQEYDLPPGLAAAADSIPDDAPPADEPPKQKQPRNKTVSRKVLTDVEGKLTFWGSMLTTMLMPLDPVCIGAAAENVAPIAHSLAPIMCQSPEVVAWLTKTGNFALYADLMMAAWPVVQVMIAHHIMKTAGQEHATDNNHRGHTLNPDMYKAA